MFMPGLVDDESRETPIPSAIPPRLAHHSNRRKPDISGGMLLSVAREASVITYDEPKRVPVSHSGFKCG